PSAYFHVVPHSYPHHPHSFPTRRSSDLRPLEAPVAPRHLRRPRVVMQGAEVGEGVLPAIIGDDRSRDVELVGQLVQADEKPRPKDRKSTRLNSSHVKISYAVFCLKKKKK